MRKRRGSPQYVTGAHPHRHLNALHAVHDQQAQLPIEVDDRLGVVQLGARPVLVQHAGLRVALVVDILVGLEERVQVAGHTVVADRLQQPDRTRRVIDFQAALRQPLYLRLEGQPPLRVNHGALLLQKENQPAPCGSGLIVMSETVARVADRRLASTFHPVPASGGLPRKPEATPARRA